MSPDLNRYAFLWPKWWPFLTEQTNELPEV